jgi:hypothetical protein
MGIAASDSAAMTYISPRAVADCLRAARQRIEAGWSQNSWACDAEGRELPEGDEPQAVAWSIYCAMHLDVPTRAFPLAYRSMCDVYNREQQAELLDWERAPERTKDDVLECFDRAIAALEAAYS